MEISAINRISDFEASITFLNNPSFLSQIYALSWFQAYHFWKWGALILVLLASLSTIINRLNILIIRSRRNRSLTNQPLLYGTDFDTDTDSSSCSSSDDEGEYDEPSASQNWRQVDEDFRVRGSGHFTLRKRRSSIGDLFSWAEELTSGKSVVKLWDNLGLGFRLDLDESDNVLNVYDVNKETRMGSIFGGKNEFQAVSASSPAVVVSAGADSSTGRVAVSVWDTRLHCRGPAILTEWSPKKPMEKISAVNADGVDKVYIRDHVTGTLTVSDMRKASSPLSNVTNSDVDTWWDADAVIVSDESVDESMGLS
ncbi:uncharacterized protein LOC120215230 isoform X3 [Hibiscus syriacus]|uniref:uncharacterized protein LOC120215230 isoform X2 n=1 Tax=Hibiscus syriacus TaxID=106335 RepID=UPI0019233810|nr:uncharacterized protein LOC120215230 isoform X2 [Hibiscus syriacus]XP_039068887.1 uncharacterized protein LOC120215230 isoform X3 [Hibiscus syriacus]